MKCNNCGKELGEGEFIYCDLKCALTENKIKQKPIEIEVKKCFYCPFFSCEKCLYNKNIKTSHGSTLPPYVPNDCPLKGKQITIKLKD